MLSHIVHQFGKFCEKDLKIFTAFGTENKSQEHH